MSFSKKTKDELARLFPPRQCCQLAELAALIRLDGTIQISGGRGLALMLNTENAAVARKIFILCKKLFGIYSQIVVQRNTQLRKHNIYLIRIASQPRLEQMLRKLGIMTANYELQEGIKTDFLKRSCCRRAYLRGAFLGGGSVNNPEKEYHLEIVTAEATFGVQLQTLINSFGLAAKSCRRKGNAVTYLKEADQIAEFLNIVGAHKALLDFENVRIYKGVKNEVNRLVNCDTANLNKTIEAAMEQIENIKLIESKIGLANLPDSLTELIKLRLEHPEASLQELGAMLDPPVSKSGVNHRMRRLARIARELREGSGEA